MPDPVLESKPEALWSGRFKQSLSELAHKFSSSIVLDGKLYREDIAGSIAHTRMLGSIGILNEAESLEIIQGLEMILHQIEDGSFIFSSDEEDVHMAIEKKLVEIIGDGGKKLHTGRSRNDQVALDERLYLKRCITEITGSLLALQHTLLRIAEENQDIIMPGYTHLQRAQPVLLSHHMLAYLAMLDRDRDRFSANLKRFDLSPLGAAAFAGSPFPLDREMVASELGFRGIVSNSIDAVSDRDYLIEFVSACSITMMHLSRLAEELIIWSSSEFGFVQMSDAVTTGSSIMPQKKNPDMAELVRGKTGKVYGALINLLTIMKGLPLAYNRDMQEDKQPMFDAAETTLSSIQIINLVLCETEFKAEQMHVATREGFLNATEMADYLVKKGVPFRQAHEIVGRAVSYCDSKKLCLDNLSLEELQSFSADLDAGVYEVLTPDASISNKRSTGSTSYVEVVKQFEYWRSVLVLS